MTGDDGGNGADEPEVFGPIDATALREVRDLCLELEPMVESAELDDSLNPGSVAVVLSDGFGNASTARLDVRWSLAGNYAVHYTDDWDRNLRFDRHPKPDAPTRHFRPPPDAPSRPAERSCISVSGIPLVTRAVLSQWRRAYDRGTLEGFNDGADPDKKADEAVLRSPVVGS